MGTPIFGKPLIFLVQRASTAGLGAIEILFVFQPLMDCPPNPLLGTIYPSHDIQEPLKKWRKSAIFCLALSCGVRVDFTQAKQLAAETEKRAELFVASWKQKSAVARDAPTYAARDEARAGLSDMAKSLHRDPQLESLLQNRRAELGLTSRATGFLSHDLQQWLGRSRGIGISM